MSGSNSGLIQTKRFQYILVFITISTSSNQSSGCIMKSPYFAVAAAPNVVLASILLPALLTPKNVVAVLGLSA